jgi:hypothetical protein
MQLPRARTGQDVPDTGSRTGSDQLRANPQFTGGSDDEAAGNDTGCLQERQEKNMTMSKERPASTTDQREEWIDVTVTTLPDLHLVRLTSTEGDIQEYLSAEAADLAAAAEHTAGTAQWCAKYHQLLVPGAMAATGRHPFFKLHPALPLSA